MSNTRDTKCGVNIHNCVDTVKNKDTDVVFLAKKQQNEFKSLRG